MRIAAFRARAVGEGANPKVAEYLQVGRARPPACWRNRLSPSLHPGAVRCTHAYTATRSALLLPPHTWSPPPQVLESKDEAVKGQLYEEAGLLRRRQMDYAAELSGPPSEGVALPVVAASDVEAIVASWTGVPVERMSEDEVGKLANLVRPLFLSGVIP